MKLVLYKEGGQCIPEEGEHHVERACFILKKWKEASVAGNGLHSRGLKESEEICRWGKWAGRFYSQPSRKPVKDFKVGSSVISESLWGSSAVDRSNRSEAEREGLGKSVCSSSIWTWFQICGTHWKNQALLPVPATPAWAWGVWGWRKTYLLVQWEPVLWQYSRDPEKKATKALFAGPPPHAHRRVLHPPS